jgi:hypothetical protein
MNQRGRMPEVLVMGALKDLQKVRPVAGNNREETSAILYLFALSATARELSTDFSVGVDIGAKTNPFGRNMFLRYFRIFHQVGSSKCYISEFGDVNGSNRSSDQVANSNFLSTCLHRAAKLAKDGEIYPSRPRGAGLLKCGIFVSQSSTYYGVKLIPNWSDGVIKILSFRRGATPWHSLAIVLLRKYEMQFSGSFTDALCELVGGIFDPIVAASFQAKLNDERSRFKTNELALVSDAIDPLTRYAPAEGEAGDLWEAKRRISVLETFIREKGFDLP